MTDSWMNHCFIRISELVCSISQQKCFSVMFFPITLNASFAQQISANCSLLIGNVFERLLLSFLLHFALLKVWLIVKCTCLIALSGLTPSVYFRIVVRNSQRLFQCLYKSLSVEEPQDFSIHTSSCQISVSDHFVRFIAPIGLRRQFDTLKPNFSLCISVLFSSFADGTECDGFGDDAGSCVFGLRPYQPSAADGDSMPLGKLNRG